MMLGDFQRRFWQPPRAHGDVVENVFERVSSPADTDDPRNAGCLMVNTMFEIDEPAQDIAKEIAQYRDLWRSTFQQALEADHINNAEARAEFLLGALCGALSQIRLAGNTTRRPTNDIGRHRNHPQLERDELTSPPVQHQAGRRYSDPGHTTPAPTKERGPHTRD